MNWLIGEMFRTSFNSISWHDLTAGCVSVQTKQVADKVKRFPVYCITPENDCQQPVYDLVPNSGKYSILYCEDGGVRVKENENSRIPSLVDFVSRIRVVCWYHTKILRGNLVKCLSLDLAAQLSTLVPMNNTLPDGNVLSNVHLKLISEEPKTQAIFSKYTYEETEKQYLMFPYDYFALNYELEFSFDPSCLEPINPDLSKYCDVVPLV